VVVFAGVSTNPAHPFRFETRGGPKLKTDDGNIEIGFNARTHLDIHSFKRDEAREGIPPFGSQSVDEGDRSGFNWRRTYTTFTGKIYRLNFILRTILPPGVFPAACTKTGFNPPRPWGFRVRPVQAVSRHGRADEFQRDHYDGAASNSFTGIYAGRQFLVGMGYKGRIADQLGYAADVMTMSNAEGPYKGLTFGERLFWIPLTQEGNTLHLGFR
jgi:phosphate-selective porin OprO/OprP